MQVFLVGGAVRDQLLGLTFKERDWVVVGATPEAMTEQGFIAVGKDFPVFLHPESKEEYALARTERKVRPGYHGFVFHADEQVSLEEDLYRRDLTINAMAYDESKRLIDPWGGMRDLNRKCLRHVSPAFVEDPVRVLRVARFAARFHALGFVVAEETMNLMRTMCESGEVSALVPERVWRELETALDEPTPAEFFNVLHEVGALKIVLPALAPLYSDAVFAKQALDAVNRACEQTSDKRIVFAVLGVWTELQRSERGTLPDELCGHLRAPKAYRTFLHAAIKLQELMMRKVVTSEDLLTFFVKSGILREAEILKTLLSAGRFFKLAIDRSEQSNYVWPALLTAAHQALSSLNLGSVVAQCDHPHDIEKVVQSARLAVLSDVLAAYQ